MEEIEKLKELYKKITNFKKELARLNRKNLTVSTDYILKEILGFSDEEIKKNKRN